MHTTTISKAIQLAFSIAILASGLTLPTSSTAWEGSKHKALSGHIKKEDSSYDVIVGGDFNDWTVSVVMKGLLKACNLENVVTEPSIDRILYSGSRSIKLLGTKRDWGPKNLSPTNLKAEGCLSDHPWIWWELKIPVGTNTQ